MKKFLIVVFILFQSLISAQQKDIKVGLVLSGGGAKGLAHVAVIKVLEEAGIRVDYIGGTSMGAIIGALYASGYTGEQLDSIIRSIDFNKVLSDDLPRKAKPFYEKEIGEKYAVVLPIKNKKVGIPTALTYGQNVQNLLTKLTQHVNNITDFRELPIPFLCIATNLETGTQEVLDKGFLPEAVKASGAFPTLLAPVEIDGKLLTDGGIVNNFPVDEVKAMGADIIIGVDIQTGLDKKGELDSAVKIINQIVGFQMYKKLDDKHDRVDLLIKPDMSGFTVVSFDKLDEIMNEGDITARKQFQQLKDIASSQQKNTRKKINTSRVQKFHITGIEIKGNKHYTRAYILGKLKLKKRDTTSYKKLIESVNNLTATGNFEDIQYKIVPTKEGGSIIKFKVREQKVAHFLQLGVHYDDLYKTGILVNTTAKHLFFKNDVVSTDLILGDNLRYNFNYFIDNGFYWSFGIKSRYNNFSSNVKFEEASVNKINLEYEDFTNQIYFQTVFGRKFAIGAGLEHKRLKAFTETITSIDNTIPSNEDRLYFDKSDYINFISYLKIDTYDKKYFQKKGVFLDIDFRLYMGSTDFNNNFVSFSQMKGKAGFSHTFFKKLTFQYVSEAGITIGENNNRILDYNIGGYGENYINNFVPFLGFDFAQLYGDAFLKSTFVFRYEVFPKNYVSTTANFARVENDLFNKGRIFENTKQGYMVGYGLDTFLGPIEINYSWSPDSNQNYWYFNVGYWF